MNTDKHKKLQAYAKALNLLAMQSAVDNELISESEIDSLMDDLDDLANKHYPLWLAMNE